MATIFHRIKAILIPNLLTEDPDDFYAKVISERTLNTDDICSSAVERGNAPTTKEAMKINQCGFVFQGNGVSIERRLFRQYRLFHRYSAD
jgi:hypothetical protein